MKGTHPLVIHQVYNLDRAVAFHQRSFEVDALFLSATVVT